MKSHYQTLEVSRTATLAEVKTAYKRLTLKYHPDKHHDNVEAATVRQQELNGAYEVLKDPHSRRRYDFELGPEVEHETVPETVTVPQSQSLYREYQQSKLRVDAQMVRFDAANRLSESQNEIIWRLSNNLQDLENDMRRASAEDAKIKAKRSQGIQWPLWLGRKARDEQRHREIVATIRQQQFREMNLRLSHACEIGEEFKQSRREIEIVLLQLIKESDELLSRANRARRQETGGESG